MLLRATDALAQHSAGKDSNGKTALFYAENGLEVLLECEGIVPLHLSESYNRCAHRAEDMVVAC
jgi:hypothetical protein